MATFPEISARDFHTRFDGNRIVQGPVAAPFYPFQHTSNFDYYRPCHFDFCFLNPPHEGMAVLRNDLASACWESLKMKNRYIMAAAHGWKGDGEDEPLPMTIPAEKLVEIGMIYPPFPPVPQLAHNFLLLPESPSTIRARLAMWQENSRQLAAWISKAKLHCALIPNCSWTWPPDPMYSPPARSEPSTEKDEEEWEPNPAAEDSVLVEAAEPSSKLTMAHICTLI
jgi:hypothetical protein